MPGKQALETARRFATSRDFHAARDAWTKVLDIAVGNEEYLLERAKCSKALGDTDAIMEDTMYVDRNRNPAAAAPAAARE